MANPVMAKYPEVVHQERSGELDNQVRARRQEADHLEQ
jgi:hypothetical protein